jgi:tRNA-2-methylthio-N6-dimethylallyladenosine synthase
VKVLYWNKPENTKKLFIESYGCAMNFRTANCSFHIVRKRIQYHILEEADLVLVNTCSIRDKAEQTVRKRLENTML